MNNSILKLIFFVFLAGFISSCDPDSTETKKERIFKGYHVALDSLIKTPAGVLRGLELGSTQNEVKAIELKTPAEADESYLLYEYPIDSVSNYTIAYTFAKDSLDGIELQINCKNIDQGSIILNDIKNYYQKKYTAPLMDKGIYVFNCFDSKKRNFNISLTDNSGIDNAVINVLIYKEN